MLNPAYLSFAIKCARMESVSRVGAMIVVDCINARVSYLLRCVCMQRQFVTNSLRLLA